MEYPCLSVKANIVDKHSWTKLKSHTAEEHPTNLTVSIASKERIAAPQYGDDQAPCGLLWTCKTFKTFLSTAKTAEHC